MHATDLILHILHCEKLVKTQLGFLVYLVDRRVGPAHGTVVDRLHVSQVPESSAG